MAAVIFEGSFVVGGMGFVMKPSEDLPLSFNLGVQGYTGRREASPEAAISCMCFNE